MSHYDFVEDVRIRRENQPLVEKFGMGAVGWAQELIYTSVDGCLAQIRRFESSKRDYTSGYRAALAIIEREGGRNLQSKKKLIEKALRKADPAFEPAPDSTHRCAAIGCNKAISPKYLMCFTHWAMVPRDVQAAVWRHYRPGQPKGEQPSSDYLAAAKAAIKSVREQIPTKEEPLT
ncbi:hypothetical protein EON83_10995 [bacterium]|nr:MAG: hypothetical protein EON83_10995 [bacterium]